MHGFTVYITSINPTLIIFVKDEVDKSVFQNDPTFQFLRFQMDVLLVYPTGRKQ